MKKNCLTCKYEPVWSELVGKDYPRRTGACQWNKEIPILPHVYILTKSRVVRYSDDSGIPNNCKAWEKKS